MDPAEHFDLIFGAVFGLIGVVLLVAGVIMCIVFRRRPPIVPHP